MDFENRLKSHYHVPHCFDLINGYPFFRAPPCGIGSGPTGEQSIAFARKEDPTLYDPALSYGRVKTIQTEPFRPHFVRYDKKCLTFKAFFKQNIPQSAIEHYRIRHVNITYFLEDDTITVMEPEVPNSGLPQGRLIRRGKIAKNVKGECYNWKDFNIGIDLKLNGMVFHITNCDPFTRNFLVNQGIELNQSECSPIDPVTADRAISKLRRRPSSTSKCYDDKLRGFLEFQGKVLKFDCILDESDRPNGETLTYTLFYYLEDDTVSIKELKENYEGRDRFPMFLRRTKLPKNWKGVPINFPKIYLEVSDQEITEYYLPNDFLVGETISVFGKQFLLLDCDAFTRRYYEEILKINQQERLCIQYPKHPATRKPLPVYLGLGTPEDSLASCFRLMPKAPRKDIVKYLFNTNKFLRYECVLDSAHPEDKNRKFILSYSLANDTISIVEPPIKNSGIIGGRFLTSERVELPDCDRNNPLYYGPKDFYIGAILKMNSHRFQIVGADFYVLQYMKEHPELFTNEAMESVEQYLLKHHPFVASAELQPKARPKTEVRGRSDHVVTEIEQCLQDVFLHSSVKEPDPKDVETLLKNEEPSQPINKDWKKVPVEGEKGFQRLSSKEFSRPGSVRNS